MIAVSPSEYKIILNIIAKHAGDCDVLAFGSRYTWTNKDYSDLDLALKANNKLGLKRLGKIASAFEESELPFRVDVLDYNTISPQFRAIIDAGHERIHQAGWTLTRLGTICKTNQRTYSVSEKWPFVNYLDTGNITENRVSEIQHIVIGHDTLPSRARRKVAIDDILYSTVHPNQRHYGIVKGVLPNMLVSTGFTVIAVDKEKANSDYIYYYLTQNDIVDGLHAIGEQSVSAYPSIKPSDIEGLELLLPPLAEQVEIGRILRSLDDKIANNMKINNHLEQMAQAIFKSWFVDFEPWGGVMPDDWRDGTLSDICAYNRERIEVSGLTTDTYVSTENMSPNKGGFSNAAGLPTIAQTTAFIPGDTLVSNICPYFKKIVYCNFVGGCSTDVLCFRPYSDMFSLYLYNALYDDGFFDYMVAGSKETKMPRGDKQQIMNYHIVIPTDTVLEDFKKSVAPMNEKRLLHINESARLADLRDTLLPRLMSGELSVADLDDAR
ncbi:MAG: restriction endonuclease subunit S [Desulfobulbaceae bacterium]|jgi:type I restriction enzyme S subunit|nr:restriction endonuclease subunit S [Desulfobulbaceae bacterium]